MKNTQKNFKTIAHFPVLNEKELKEVLGGDLRNIFLKIKFKKKYHFTHVILKRRSLKRQLRELIFFML